MEISLSGVHANTANAFLKVAMGSLLLALASQISFILPYTPILVTFQTAALFVLGMTLGPVPALAAVALYLMEGIAGLPVFAFGQSGLAVLLGPKGGYYLGFCLAAFISGFAEKEHSFLRLMGTFLLSNVAIYAVGLTWLAAFIGSSHVLALGLYPFIGGDLLKIAAISAGAKGFSVIKL